jgi:hypothetical protein
VFEQNRCENLEYHAKADFGKGFMIEELNAPVHDLTVRNNVIQAFNFLTVHNCEDVVIVNNTSRSDLSFTSTE